MTIGYLYSKFFKKILRGKSVLDSKVDSTALIYSGTEFYESSLGRHSYVGYDCEVQCCDIGAFCSIANGVVIGGAAHAMEWVSTSPVFLNTKSGPRHRLALLDDPCPTKRTVIGNDVWIGSRAIILQGVKVGNGAVIGAGAIVTKDVPDYAIVVGSPAHILRYRFDEETVKGLLRSKWWVFEDEKLASLSKYMNNPVRFLREISNPIGGGYNRLIFCMLQPNFGRAAA